MDRGTIFGVLYAFDKKTQQKNCNKFNILYLNYTEKILQCQYHFRENMNFF